MRAEAAVFALALSLGPASAGCRAVEHEGRGYAVCEAPAGSDLRLFLEAPEGGPHGSFESVNRALAAEGKALRFAMNAGMYHADRAPVGLYIEKGREVAPLVLSDGPGNFGLLPNGVFCIRSFGFSVFESNVYAQLSSICDYATQSGPMLVIDGALHPKFLADSTSRYVRNGVGVDENGNAFFAISDSRVTFHEFARLFRDVLGTPNALYLDGSISRLYAPELDRADLGLPMGPIVGLVAEE